MSIFALCQQFFQTLLSFFLSKRVQEDGRPIPWNFDFVPTSPTITEKNYRVDHFVRPFDLCPMCRQFRHWLQREYRDRSIDKEMSTAFSHYTTGLALEHAYEKNCHFCTLVWQSFHQPTYEGFDVTIPRKLGRFQDLRSVTDIKIELLPEPNSRRKGWPKYNLRAVGKLPNSEDQYTKGHTLGLKATKEALPVLASAAAYFTSTDSRRKMDLAQSWIDDCLCYHNQCSRAFESSLWLPTRLVDTGPMGGPIKLRLIETRDESIDDPYMTLSYCWGGIIGSQLTLANLNDMKTGMSLSKLPKTIQDAIRVTRQLNVRYLWVDSLCIIQNCRADWQIEAASMADVYRNSFLTIAALGASNSEQGLFSKRDPLSCSPCWMFKDEDDWEVFVHPDIEDQMLKSWVDFAPLHDRGWVVQERLLSPRTLNFGVPLVWECCEISANDLGLENFTESTATRFNTPFRQRYNQQPENRLRHGEQQTSMQDNIKFLKSWRSTLKLFTGTTLSIKADRLPAIQGLIKEIQRSTGWKNAFGLWECFMVEELMWSPDQTPHARLPNVPTWSWISVEGRVIYAFQVSNGISTFEFQAQIELPDPGSHIGMIQGPEVEAGLRITSFIFPLHREASSRCPKLTYARHSHVYVEGSEFDEGGSIHLIDTHTLYANGLPGGWSMEITFKYDVQQEKPESLFFLLLGEVHLADLKAHSEAMPRPERRCHLAGLVISKSGKTPDAYERVALVNVVYLMESCIFGSLQEVQSLLLI